MCGICGIWYFDRNQRVDERLLDTMTAQLVHRGPDEAGFYRDGALGFGVRRLKVIDTEGSHQPLRDESGQLRLICNGEIYNFRSLRDQLARTHRFQTQGDIEPILHLYEDFGLRCVDHLRGMFAFALWDGFAERLLLAQDRFGQKPLYYALDSEKIVFGSELKALLACPTLSRDLDCEALDDYFACGYIGAPRSIYARIRKLPPGHRLCVGRDGMALIERYWQPEFADASEWDRRSSRELAEELRGLLVEAVRLRMTSDVPLGAFLSGGVDSSAVVALMRQVSGAPVKTYSVGFDEAAYDERRYAQASAAHYQTEHHSTVMRSDALDLLPRLVRHFDEPFADASMLPTYLVSQLARQQVTVALSGDGGDEVFGGYHQHLYGYRQQYLESIIPAPLHSSAARLARFVPRAAKIKPYLAAVGQPAQRWIGNGFFSAEQRADLYSGDLRLLIAASDGQRLKQEMFGRDRLAQLQAHDLRTYLPGDILVKLDRASMLASLEVRSPLLDHVVFEFMARVPPNQRMALSGGKRLLKLALGTLLPPFVQRRKKQGFSIPQAEWLRGALDPLLREAALKAVATGMFNRAYVERLIREHRAGHDHKDRLWALLCFGLWT